MVDKKNSQTLYKNTNIHFFPSMTDRLTDQDNCIFSQKISSVSQKAAEIIDLLCYYRKLKKITIKVNLNDFTKCFTF